MINEKKFYTNDERFAHLKEMWSGDEAQSKRATKLAREWLKTVVFDIRDFERCMVVYAQANGVQ